MKFRKIVFYELLITLIIIVNEKYFFLTPNFGSWTYVLLTLTVASIVVLLLRKCGVTYYFKSFIFLYLFMNVISATITILEYDQPLELAISRYRFVFFILLYFPMKYFIQKIETYNIERIIIFLAIFAALITILQKFTYGKVLFISNGIGLRDGQFRTYQSQIIVSIAIILLIQYLLESKKNLKFKSRIRVVLCLIPLLYYTFFISMTRSAELCLLGTILIQVIINIDSKMKSYSSKGIWQISSILILGIAVFLGYQYAIEMLRNSIDIKEASSIIRQGAIQYYLQMFIKNPLFGYGLYSNTYSYGLVITGGDLKYFADDIGIFGFMFQYGITGILIGLYLCIRVFHKIRQFVPLEKNKYLGLSCYFILILPFSCLLNIDIGMVYICLYLACLENNSSKNYREIKNG